MLDVGVVARGGNKSVCPGRLMSKGRAHQGGSNVGIGFVGKGWLASHIYIISPSLRCRRIGV